MNIIPRLIYKMDNAFAYAGAIFHKQQFIRNQQAS